MQSLDEMRWSDLMAIYDECILFYSALALCSWWEEGTPQCFICSISVKEIQPVVGPLLLMKGTVKAKVLIRYTSSSFIFNSFMRLPECCTRELIIK